jgi:hypothetical protein
MKPHPDSILIFNKIKKDSGLNDAALKLIGITPEKLTTAYKQCLDNKLSRNVAIRTVFSMWKNGHPEAEPSSVKANDMELMGFFLTPYNTWKHKQYSDIEIGITQLKHMSFEEIEALVIKKKGNEQTK